MSPIQELAIKEMQPDVKLWWETISSALSYEVFRDTISIFTPDITNQIGATPETTFVDENVTLLPAVKHYYIVQPSEEPPSLAIPGTKANTRKTPHN